jgi:hypothetical protein
MRILLMAGILLQKTRLNVLLVNTLSILKSPTRPTIFRRWCIQRRRDLKGAGSNRGEYGRFCSTMRDEHHGNIEFRRHKIASLMFRKRI